MEVLSHAQQPFLYTRLLRRFLARPGGPRGAFVDRKEVNLIMPDWIVVNMGVDPKVALRMLEKKWRLPVRAKRPAAVVAGATRGSVLLSKKRTMAYRYLHRVVYHFYERIGNTAVSTFASYVNEEEGRGTLRRVRGTQTQVGNTAAWPRVLVCPLGHLAVVTMKVRQHLKKCSGAAVSLRNDPEAAETTAVAGAAARATARAKGASAAAQHEAARVASAIATEAEIEATPGLNSGHRAEWVEELPLLSSLLAAQRARASNGLRLSDGAEPRRADPTHMPGAAFNVLEAGGALPGASSGTPPPFAPPPASDEEGVDEDDEGDMTQDDEEEAPVSRPAHGSDEPRRARDEDGREEAARAAAAQVLLDEHH
ncbi:hypothetical protein BU14_0135s0011 [Porphyra umbilicalis]|uniref:Uncharacterized protein n=1 Tax=Porphyra umbilicalis TaxID=2786 RepID=A0A1X6PA78_PORUM|nr:hypothetical protein BU14_0135s0011 [Porphyra umbilicalis]|eukprot:OSX77737.1 hypothetical protein BU14_0135s0011 [Porphyra umbilicalis]